MTIGMTRARNSINILQFVITEGNEDDVVFVYFFHSYHSPQ